MGFKFKVTSVFLLFAASSVHAAVTRNSLQESFDKQSRAADDLIGEPTIGLIDSGTCTKAEGDVLQPTFIRAGGYVIVQFSVSSLFRVQAWEAVMVDADSNRLKVLKGSYYKDELKAGYYSLRIPAGNSVCKDCELKLVILGQDASSLRYCAPVTVVGARQTDD